MGNLKNVIEQIWLVVVLALVFGAALAFTDRSTKELIKQNRQQQIRMLAQKATLGELTMVDGKPDFKIKLNDLGFRDKGLWGYEVADIASGKRVGYAIVAEGIGWDRLQMLIGLSADLSRITGLEVLDCRETPGLGERVKTNAFRDQYRKPTAKPLELVKVKPTSEYQVEAITGATISSTAVTDMVNANVTLIRELVKP